MVRLDELSEAERKFHEGVSCPTFQKRVLLTALACPVNFAQDKVDLGENEEWWPLYPETML